MKRTRLTKFEFSSLKHNNDKDFKIRSRLSKFVKSSTDLYESTTAAKNTIPNDNTSIDKKSNRIFDQSPDEKLLKFDDKKYSKKQNRKRPSTAAGRNIGFRTKKQYARTLRMVDQYLFSDTRYGNLMAKNIVRKLKRQVRRSKLRHQKRLKIKHSRHKPINLSTDHFEFKPHFEDNHDIPSSVAM